MQELVRASAWKGLANLIQRFGGHPEEIFKAAGLPQDPLLEPNANFPLQALVSTLEIAPKELNQPDFGLQSGNCTTEILGTINLAMQNAPTARIAVEIAARYIHIHNPGLSVTITPHKSPGEELVTTNILNDAFTASPQFSERIVASVYFQLKALGALELDILEIRFPGPRQSPLSTYTSLFGLEPQFLCDTYGVVTKTAQLDAPRKGNDESLFQVAQDHLRAIGAPKEKSLAEKVELLIVGILPGNGCIMRDVASALGLHKRTLQRRLKEEGVSFKQLKDSAKRRRAIKLLSRRDVTLTEVAFMLGYSESSTFSRKAKDWFGVSPRDYRRQLLDQKAS